MAVHIFVEIIIALAIACCCFSYFKKFDKFSISYGPEISTTLGILGCFISIVFALYNLDTGNLADTMPALLDGVKFAFISSIVGISGALAIRWKQQKKLNLADDNSENSTANDNNIITILQSIKDGLIGSEQDTLLTHLKLMRQEQKDNSNELIKEFKDFAAHMVENNQKAVIEALKEVIRDFNQNLTDQFGENFKQLNNSVEKLVVWQVQYKDELENIKNAQQQTADNMKVAVSEMKSFVNNSETFSKIAEDLSNQIRFLENNRDILLKQQQSLSEVLNKLKDVTPEFSEKANRMLDDVKNGMNQISEESIKITNKLKDNTEKNYSDMQKTVEYLSTTFNSSITQVAKNLENQISQFNIQLKDLLIETMKENNEEINKALNENLNIIKGGVTTLDAALQEELNKALEGLGRQLASLSAKFVEDYSPLTDRLREIVRIAEGA
ncbi:MAG: hypothetical protein J0H68_00845 [Sphingobacteriia bacterium]|nr:hypothetical protein [Sphingobacteriia bacterium]